MLPLLPLLSMPALLGCLVGAYTMGTNVARPITTLLRPVLLAASTGAALSRPQRGLLGPFRLAGHAISYIFGFARNGGNSGNVEMFKISVTEDLVTMFIRRDVYQVTCSVIYVAIVVGGCLIMYKLVVYMAYKIYTDLRKSWSGLDDKKNTPKLSKEQLQAISQIMIEAQASSIKKPQKPTAIQNTSYTISD